MNFAALSMAPALASLSKNEPTDNELQALFERCRAGDGAASAELLSLLYDHLHRIARRCMQGQPAGHTLQPTALVSEAYLRLSGRLGDVQDRVHLLRLAARAMRQILVDHDRRARSGKRPPREGRLDFELLLEEYGTRAIDVLEFDAALTRLGERDERLARLVELHFFAGQTMTECAAHMGVSERQAFRWWKAARAFLHREIRP